MSGRPTNILDVVATFRARLAAREAATTAAFTSAFNGIADELTSLIDDITAMIERRIDLGLEADAGWLLAQSRYRELLRQTEALVAEYAPAATSLITADQRFATDLAQTSARQLTLFQIPPSVGVTFARLPQDAVQDLIGVLGDGSPLRTILDDLGPYASGRMRQELVVGLGAGQGPREIARRLRDVPQVTRRRAELISRTEVNRAYRTSSIRTYEANRQIVQGWRWVAALDARTCLSCVVMHGTEHPVTEAFASHPACRCGAAPITRYSPPVESGAQWFEGQADDTKLRMLGPAKYRALQAAEIDLSDLTEFRNDPKWGGTRFEPSLRSILGRREAERYYAQAADD